MLADFAADNVWRVPELAKGQARYIQITGAGGPLEKWCAYLNSSVSFAERAFMTLFEIVSAEDKPTRGAKMGEQSASHLSTASAAAAIRSSSFIVPGLRKKVR